MTAPAIRSFRMADCPRASDGLVAHVTFECGPWMVSGMRLCRRLNGEFFLRPPSFRNPSDRLVLRDGPERQAILNLAVAKFFALAPTRAAVSPLAPAPGLEPHI